LCLRLSLLNTLHHLHSTCTNHPFSLVVQVDFILNSCVWVCLNPIPELKHAFLLPKCCELKSVPQFFIFFYVSFWDPHLGPLRSLGHINVRKWNKVCPVHNVLKISLRIFKKVFKDFIIDNYAAQWQDHQLKEYPFLYVKWWKTQYTFCATLFPLASFQCNIMCNLMDVYNS
jgi:hypothetical protein